MFFRKVKVKLLLVVNLQPLAVINSPFYIGCIAIISSKTCFINLEYIEKVNLMMILQVMYTQRHEKEYRV